LPPDLQAIVLNPPNLSNPSSWFPVIKAVYPYTRYIVVILACYIVWMTVTSLLGYFSRLVRFGLRIGPIIALIAYVMGQSGQGSMSDVLEIAKQWVGLPTQANTPLSPVSGMFNTKSTRKSPRNKRNDPKQSDPLSTLLNLATNAGGDNWQDTVQDYVKNAVAKASGLDWLFNQEGEREAEKSR
jgi:hypothetical protein